MALNIKKDFGTGRKPKPDLSSLVYGKIPPQCNNLEDIVIGTLLNERDAFELAIEAIPSGDYFYQDSHRKIFQAMQRLNTNGSAIDIATVANELMKTGDLEIIGGAYVLAQLSSMVTNGAHVETHSKIIAEKFMAREAIRIAGEVIAAAYDDTTDIFDMLDVSSSQLSKVTAFANGDTTEHIRGPLMIAMAEMEDMANRKVDLTGVDTGLKELNAITNGWQSEDLIIVAARPSQGKTSIALHFCIAALISNLSDSNGGVFIASLEMSKKQLTQRIISYISGVDMGTIKRGSANLQEKLLIQDAFNKIGEMNIYIEDRAGLTVKQIEKRARKVQRKLEKQGKKLLLVVTDYLQLTTVIDERKKNPEQQISESSRDAKQLAKNLECPHIALSQMSRAIESGAKRRPNLGDLRGSGAIEQDADVVIFISHETDEMTKATKNMLLISKHRNGITADIEVKFYCSNQKWTDKEDDTFKTMKTFAPPIPFDYEDGAAKRIEEDAPFK